MTLRTQLFILRHRDSLLAALIFAITLTAYMWTLCPTLYWGDCGELATAAVTLGIPHPTGYPLYCMLGKAWTLILPLGSIAWRLNTLSAVFGALAVVCLYGAARAMSLPRPIAAAAAGLFAFSFTFWQQCLVTETYTLSAFFTCLDLFLALRWRQRGCLPSDLRLLAVAYGFTLTSHQLNTLFLPGYFAFIFWTQPGLLRLRGSAVRTQWAKTLGLGLLPLLSYAYLPLRARTHPLCNWGDPETLFAFCYHVSGRLYSQSMFSQPWRSVLGRLIVWATHLPLEFSWAMIAMALLGLCFFWQRAATRPVALLLTWIFVADIVYVVNYPIYNGYIYYIPGYVVLSLCIGRAFFGAWVWAERCLEPAKRPAFALMGAVGVLLLVPMQMLGHRQVSLRGNWTCYDYGRNLLASVPPNGLLIANGDDTAVAAITYLQDVELYRADVTLIRRGPLESLYDPRYKRWTGGWYLDALCRRDPSLRALFPDRTLTPELAMNEAPLRMIIADAVRHARPLCVLAPAGQAQSSGDTPPMDDGSGKRVRLDMYLSRLYAIAPVGLLTRVYSRGGRPSESVLLAQTQRVWNSFTLRGVYDGDLQSDTYLAPLALAYSGGDLAQARLAYTQGDYASASLSYQHVLALFTCAEATDGLRRCAQAAAAQSGSRPGYIAFAP